MRRNLQLKLLLPLTLLIILLPGVACYVLYSQSATALRDALVLNLEREAESMQRRTEDMLKTTMAHAQRAAKDPEILEELARADGPDLPALTGHLQALADSCPF